MNGDMKSIDHIRDSPKGNSDPNQEQEKLTSTKKEISKSFAIMKLDENTKQQTQ